MTIIYPGSFDPVTAGHIDIACRAAKLANRVVVAVLDNPNKKTLFTADERISFLAEALSSINNIEIDSFSGLLVEFVMKKNADAILRGVRNSEDFLHETKYAVNIREYKQIETIFLPATPALSYVSSTIIKEAAAHIYKTGSDNSFVKNLVPVSAQEALRKKYER
ncbi:MAG: pantetheine-phosphate adenylyltransferase [Clostridiales bacterium]|jgi:pantetheine-phosphate adenylyltransferase|nr:pantetheine-phosphate adenylyltransferase [Clostridiales bacterium]